MVGGRMWREEVSFLQADCWMERLRDRQMTMAERPGPECRLRETYTLLRVGSGCYAKCTEQRPSQRIWQGDPFTHPPTPPIHLLPAAPLFLSSLTPNQEVMRWHRGWRQVSGCYLYHYCFCIFFIVCGFFFPSLFFTQWFWFITTWVIFL